MVRLGTILDRYILSALDKTHARWDYPVRCNFHSVVVSKECNQEIKFFALLFNIQVITSFLLRLD